MANQTRNYELGGVYHLYNRGAQRGNIFHQPVDYLRFLATLDAKAANNSIEILAYCLMTNHYHLLVQIKDNGDLSRMMTGLGVSYSRYYNQAYQSSGHIFGDRFQIRRIKDNEDLLNVSRYIHKNPAEFSSIETYPWSSCGQYVFGNMGIANTQLIMGLLASFGTKDYKVFLNAPEMPAISGIVAK